MQKTPKTYFKKSETPIISELASRFFAPIPKRTTSTPTLYQHQEQTQKLLQRKTNLLAIPGLMAEPKTRRPQTIQAKLTIGEPRDKYEQEADAVATQIVQQIHQPHSDKFQLESLPEDDQLQMKPIVQQRTQRLHENQEVSQTQSKVIQRTTDKEVKANLSGELLEYYEEWLEMTGANSSPEAFDVILTSLTIEELKEKLEGYEERGLNEDDPPNKWEQFLPDITPFAEVVDGLLAQSPDFGSYIKQRQTQGVNSADNVKVLGESDFLEAFVNELKIKYQRSGQVPEFSEQVNTKLNELSSKDNSFDSYLKANVAILKEAEKSNAFTSNFVGENNRAIYLRKSMFDNITETYIHELMHRYSSLNFVAALSTSINEGLTDLFMQQLLTSKGFRIETKSYTKEVQLVQKLIEVFFNNDSTIFKEAYFQGNIQPLISRISTKLEPEKYNIILKDGDIEEQMRILQQMESGQKGYEEVETPQTKVPKSEESEQKTKQDVVIPQTNEPTSSTRPQTNAPTSKENEQKTEQEIEIPRTNEPTSSKRKRKRDIENSDKQPQNRRKSKRLAAKQPE